MSVAEESLEKLFEAMDFLRKEQRQPKVLLNLRLEERLQWTTDIVSLERADPFYWNSRTVNLVNSTLDSFQLEEIDCSRHVLSCDVAWHWFAENPPFEIEEISKTRMIPVRAITWYWFGRFGQPYLGATAWGQSAVYDSTGLFTGPVHPILWTCVNAGDKLSQRIKDGELHFVGYTDERTELESRLLMKWVVASSTFLRQEILPVEKTEVSRHARKRIEKRGHKTRTIQVVQLRKTHSERTEPDENREVCHRYQDYRGWVRGHVRKQWYATLGEHLPVFISPFLKGPEGKPIRPRTTPIFSVTK